jgi:hypothetical protein
MRPLTRAYQSAAYICGNVYLYTVTVLCKVSTRIGSKRYSVPRNKMMFKYRERSTISCILIEDDRCNIFMSVTKYTGK